MVKYETWVHALLAAVAVGALVLRGSLCGMVYATDAGVSAGHFGTAFIARLC